MRKMYLGLSLLLTLLLLNGCGSGSVPESADSTGSGESNTVTASLSEAFATVELPENITLDLASDTVDYPSQVNVFEDSKMIDFASMADTICPVLLGSDYEESSEGRYSLVTDDSRQVLSLGSGNLHYYVNYLDGKGSSFVMDIADYDSVNSRYDSAGAQMKGTALSDYDVGGDLDGLSHETAVNAVTGILEDIGFTNLSVSRWVVLSAEDLQKHLDTVEEINDEFKGMQVSEEDECYLIAFEFSNNGLNALGRNETSAATQVGGVEIRCIYGREGLIDLYCCFVPDTAAGGSKADTISPEAAAKVFAEEYALWQERPRTVVSIDLEYVIHNTPDVMDSPSDNVCVPAWVFTVEYVKTFPGADGETLEYTYHDYVAVNAATGEFLGR